MFSWRSIKEGGGLVSEPCLPPYLLTRYSSCWDDTDEYYRSVRLNGLGLADKHTFHHWGFCLVSCKSHQITGLILHDLPTPYITSFTILVTTPLITHFVLQWQNWPWFMAINSGQLMISRIATVDKTLLIIVSGLYYDISIYIQWSHFK